jgi:hypothetical protein
VCAVGAATVLQGCGGGSGQFSGACKNPAIDMVTSSLKSTTKLDATATSKSVTTTQSQTQDSSSKIDLTSWNARIDGSSTISMKIDSPSLHMDMEQQTDEKMILDVEKKLLVVSIKTTNTTSGKVILQNCSAITIPQMPAPAEIGMAWNLMKGEMQKLFKCGGNDGTHDKWIIDFVHHKDDPSPIPGQSLPKFDLTVDMEVQMDANYLVHSESMTMTMDMPDIAGSGESMKETETSTTDVTQASATGPSAADLDYSSWGKCTAITPPGHEFLNDFRGFKKDRKGTVKNLIIATLQMALDMQGKEQKFVV